MEFFNNINIDVLQPLQEVYPDAWFDDVRQIYGKGLSDEMVSQSMEEIYGFFHIDEPAIVSRSWITGVYPNNDFTFLNDNLFFNCEQLLEMGISGKNGLDLAMTHEGTYRILQEMECFDSCQEELCCDYMVGVRAELNGIDLSQLESSIMYTPETGTHPAGIDRVKSMEAGIRFVQQYYAEYNMVPTFDECFDNFCEINETELDKQIIYRMDNSKDRVSFKGVLPPDNNSDGYIPDGNVILERVESNNTDSFKVYNKDGGRYVYEGKWIRIDGGGTVNIKGVKYNKI